MKKFTKTEGIALSVWKADTHLRLARVFDSAAARMPEHKPLLKDLANAQRKDAGICDLSRDLWASGRTTSTLLLEVDEKRTQWAEQDLKAAQHSAPALGHLTAEIALAKSVELAKFAARHPVAAVKWAFKTRRITMP